MALEEAKLPADRVALFVSGFSQLAPTIREDLVHLAPSLGRIVDVDWRLDYYVKSQSLERVKLPVYFLRLKTVTPAGEVKDIEFTCSFQELQDMLARLRDSTKQVERLVGATKDK